MRAVLSEDTTLALCKLTRNSIDCDIPELITGFRHLSYICRNEGIVHMLDFDEVTMWKLLRKYDSDDSDDSDDSELFDPIPMFFLKFYRDKLRCDALFDTLKWVARRRREAEEEKQERERWRFYDEYEQYFRHAEDLLGL